MERGWSQEHVAELSGLSVRTIQRIENGQTPGLASLAALAGAFSMDVGQFAAVVTPEQEPTPTTFVEGIRTCLAKYAVFDGRAGRSEYWWFMLFVILAGSVGATVHEALGSVVLLCLLVPLVAAGTRRLHDTGHSGWWQLFGLAPFGVVVPLVLLALPSTPQEVEP